jgi:hypothetical protein
MNLAQGTSASSATLSASPVRGDPASAIDADIDVGAHEV